MTTTLDMQTPEHQAKVRAFLAKRKIQRAENRKRWGSDLKPIKHIFRYFDPNRTKQLPAP